MIEDCVFWYLTYLPTNQPTPSPSAIHLLNTIWLHSCKYIMIFGWLSLIIQRQSNQLNSVGPSASQPGSQSVNLLFISTPFARVSVPLSLQVSMSKIHSTSFHFCVKLRRCHNFLIFLIWALKEKKCIFASTEMPLEFNSFLGHHHSHHFHRTSTISITLWLYNLLRCQDNLQILSFWGNDLRRPWGISIIQREL